MNQNMPILEDDLLPSLAKPVLGEKLFRGDLPDSQNNACPHWYAEAGNWDLIAAGYLHAAHALVEELLAKRVLADEMLYPVCFLYRHCIELRLKHVASLGHRLKDGEYKAPSGHNLSELWKSAHPVLRDQVHGTTPAELETIASQIAELQNIDSKSDEFRYPVTMSEKVALTGLQHVNLRHMRDVMCAMDTVLAGSVVYLVEAIHEKGVE
jgi:hypothetical protein